MRITIGTRGYWKRKNRKTLKHVNAGDGLLLSGREGTYRTGLRAVSQPEAKKWKVDQQKAEKMDAVGETRVRLPIRAQKPSTHHNTPPRS